MNTFLASEQAVLLTDAIQDVLNRFDPLDVTPGTFAPVTEYSHEAEAFVRLFTEYGFVTVADVRNVGVHSLRDPDWVSPEDLYAFHAELMAAYGRFVA